MPSEKRKYIKRKKGSGDKDWFYNAIEFDPRPNYTIPIVNIYDVGWKPCEFMLEPPELTCILIGKGCEYRYTCNYDDCVGRKDMKKMRKRNRYKKFYNTGGKNMDNDLELD